MKGDTRQQLIEAGVALLYTQGYHKTGIKQVLDAVQVPKGSFYHYFESKEAFGHALLDHYSSEQLRAISAALADPAHPPLERLRRLFERLTAEYAARQSRYFLPSASHTQAPSPLVRTMGSG